MDNHPEEVQEHSQRSGGNVSIPVSYNRLLVSKTSEPLDEYDNTPHSLPTAHRTHKSHQFDAAASGPWGSLAREQWLGVLSMMLLIIQGTALSLILRISRCVQAACNALSQGVWCFLL